jgi:hypothetical protein
MRTLTVSLLAGLAIVAAGCGATTRTTSATVQSPVYPTLSSAIATFVSREHGKDKDSGLAVQLLRDNGELVGDTSATGIKFDDHSSSGPFSLSLAGGPFTTRDIDDGQVRVRLTPDGRDDWTFDLHLTMRFSDGRVQNFAWRGVRLDNSNLERVLALSPARTS